MKKISLLPFFVFISLTLHAEADRFNTYQFQENSRTPWFEWWYYKVVLPETGESFYFVYGVVNPWDKEKTMAGTRSYVGMGDFKNNLIVENKFAVSDFYASHTQTLIEVKNNHASDLNFSGSVEHHSGDQYSWDISIQKDWSYNPVSWALGKGITDIEWYPAQASAHCSGTIISKNQLHQFTNAPCYQDRNWGKQFPTWWTWIVSNQFNEDPDSTLAVGGGKPQYYGRDFPLSGVSIGLRHKGVDYHFRPNDLDIIKTNVSMGQWEVSGENREVKITVDASAPKESFMDLRFLTPDGNIFHDYETLTGKVTVKIFRKKRLKWVLSDTLTSDFAGIEYGSK
jgi:tocopherol cyclase